MNRNRSARPRKPLANVLFLDLLVDPRSRPIFIYAAIVIGAGASFYHWFEGWGWLDSFYFVVITLTTVGYGDLHPTRPLSKLLTIFYGLNGIILLLMLFDVVRTIRGWSLEDLSAAPKEHETPDDDQPSA